MTSVDNSDGNDHCNEAANTSTSSAARTSYIVSDCRKFFDDDNSLHDC